MKAKGTEQEALAERTRANEAFFESCIDIIPARIYLNQDDRTNWFKLVANSSRGKKASSVDDDVENGVAEEDEADEENLEDQDLDFVVKHSRFDPRFCKTVSQIYKDLSLVKEKPTKIKFETNKNAEANKNIKIENKTDAKTKTSGNSAKNAEKKAEKRKLKKEKQSKNKEIKNKNIKLEKNLANTKESANETGENNIVSKQKKPILNSNGDVVYSKFDFSVDKKASQGSKKNKSSKNLALNAKPKDYKTLVKQLQEKKEKIQQLKETEPEKALQMETEDKWKSLIQRASGVKVKDDVDLLKKSIKRIEKKKDKSKKNWKERVASVEKAKNSAQEKRQKNIEARKAKKKEHKIKRLKKKGRILPGF